MRSRSLIFVIVMTLAMVSWSAAPAQARPTIPAAGYGFSDGGAMIFTNGRADTTRELDAIREAGGSWMRLGVDWSRIEPQRGKPNWSTLDYIYDQAQARGIRILANLTFAPTWANGRAGVVGRTAPPRDPATFATFARQYAQRYGSRTDAYEIWNEPNLPIFFGGQWSNRAASYTKILRAAYPALKSVAPTTPVIAAGLSRGDGADAPPAFVTAMYAAGAHGFFDALAMHPYIAGGDGTLAGARSRGWLDVASVRSLMVARGDASKKIWFTEFGAPTGPRWGPAWLATLGGAFNVTQAEQARQIELVMSAIAGLEYAGPAFVYSIRDTNTRSTQGEANFGALYTTDWKRKTFFEHMAS